MTRDKDLKRLVRNRMKKTGEAYTTARANITRQAKAKKAGAATRAPVPVAAAPKNLADIGGRSDATMQEKTGRTWQGWLDVLQREGADALSHGEIATLLNEKYGVSGWWSQTVTVGYERITGRRVLGQRLDGSYEASKSRTFNVPVSELFDAWAVARTRRRWLKAEVKVRTATAPKSMRLGWSDGAIISVNFSAKGATKSVVALAHPKLRDRESADRMKQFWTEQLDALAKILS